MFMKPLEFSPALLDAAEAAVRAIPPAFPLDATVAVNPFLGQSGEDLATASARLSRVAGASLTRPRADYLQEIAAGRITDDDLAAALIACNSPLKPRDLALLKAKAHMPAPAPAPLPTVAVLATEATGTDWQAVIERTVGLWAAGHFDRGQALWQPAPGRGAYAAWQDWAGRDLTPEIAGLKGFCSHAASAPDTAERAILRAAQRLGLSEASAATVFHRLLTGLGGWAQHARWLLWQAEQEGSTDGTLAGLLALRLVWEEALLAHVPQIEADWRAVVRAHEAPVTASAEDVLDAILQDAAERAEQRRLAARLSPPAGPARSRPELQAAFCIDVRSEVFRRALEAQHPGIETIGFAGFFGMPVAHQAHGSDVTEHHLPALLRPALSSSSHAPARQEHRRRIADRAVRAWGRFRQAAVSSFAFVEAAGPLYGAKLVKDAFGLGRKTGANRAPRFSVPLDAAAKARMAAQVLRGMSLRSGFGRIVLLLGHGSGLVNNPHESAYHCGACGGHSGEVPARLLAQLLNDPETRAGLATEGIDLPADTLFVAGLHDTASDEVTLFPDDLGPGHAPRVAQAWGWLAAAGRMARAERALRLPGAEGEGLAMRARNWAELRPEWGLAGCAAFIAAPRPVTAGARLGGRVFLHSYDWRADEGFATLELILTAPVVVASWISLQYYGSAVAPGVFGGGNKLIHNVTGGIGVVEGNGGRLRAGLPWQAVHDGAALVHEPLRLTVMIEAPEEAIGAVLSCHPEVAALFDNGWLHLLALRDGQAVARYRPGGDWTAGL